MKIQLRKGGNLGYSPSPEVTSTNILVCSLPPFLFLHKYILYVLFSFLKKQKWTHVLRAVCDLLLKTHHELYSLSLNILLHPSLMTSQYSLI